MKKLYITLFCLMLLFCSGYGLTAVTETFAQETIYQQISLQNEASYTIQSNGAPFYFSFGRKESAAVGEVGRVSWIISDLTVMNANDENAEFGAYCVSSSDIASGYGNDYLKAEDESIAFASETDNFYSLVIYKANASTDANYILRSGINDYTQISLGDYTDDSESCYGLYFSGVKIEITFLVTFIYGTDLTLYAGDGVTITEYAEVIEPDVSLTNASFVLSDNPDEMIRHPIYTEKISFIPFKLNESDNDTIVYYLDEITLNGERIDINIHDGGGLYYLVYSLSATDSMEIICASREVTLDEAEIYDLVEVSGKTAIQFTELRRADIGIGNIPNHANIAFRYRYNTPNTSSWSGAEINKFGMWTSNNNIWSNFGYIITFYNNTVRILSGEEVEYAVGACSAIRPRNTVEIVIGMVKGYDEQETYIFNRIYVSVNGEIVVHYDDYSRPALGSAIIGPYLENSAARCSIENAVSVCEVTDNTKNEDVIVGFKQFINEGGEAEITFVEKEGKRITQLIVNGVDVTNQLVTNGAGKVFTVESISEDISFTYEVEETYCSIFVESSQGISVDAASSIPYGEDVTFYFVPRNGYIISSVKVNGHDYTSELNNDRGNYSLTLNCVKEDIRISLSSQEKFFTVMAEDIATADINIIADSVAAGGTAAFTVTPKEGYKISMVSVNGDPVQKINGVFYVNSVYEDITIAVETATFEELSVPNDAGYGGITTGGIVGIIIGAIVILAAGVAIVILIVHRKKERKN